MDYHPDRNRWLTLNDQQLFALCRADVYQARGPGGQKRNRTYSAIRLYHKPSGIEVNAAESRSQHTNRNLALRRLRKQVAMFIRGPALDPPESWKLNPRNPQYPFLLAFLFDNLYDGEFHISDTAAEIGLSTGQLVKVMARDPEVWQRVNREREKRGMTSLRS